MRRRNEPRCAAPPSAPSTYRSAKESQPRIGEGASAEGTGGSRPSQNTALLPKFKLGEINAGRVLQRGSFGTIREIRSIRCDCDGTLVCADSSDDDEPDRQLAQDKKLLCRQSYYGRVKRRPLRHEGGIL